jgi:hypothetical protein
MFDALRAAFAAPVPRILVIAGIVFLYFCAVGASKEKKFDRVGRTLFALVGLGLCIVGMLFAQAGIDAPRAGAESSPPSVVENTSTGTDPSASAVGNEALPSSPLPSRVPATSRVEESKGQHAAPKRTPAWQKVIGFGLFAIFFLVVAVALPTIFGWMISYHISEWLDVMGPSGLSGKILDWAQRIVVFGFFYLLGITIMFPQIF